MKILDSGFWVLGFVSKRFQHTAQTTHFTGYLDVSFASLLAVAEGPAGESDEQDEIGGRKSE